MLSRGNVDIAAIGCWLQVWLSLDRLSDDHKRLRYGLCESIFAIDVTPMGLAMQCPCMSNVNP